MATLIRGKKLVILVDLHLKYLSYRIIIEKISTFQTGTFFFNLTVAFYNKALVSDWSQKRVKEHTWRDKE